MQIVWMGKLRSLALLTALLVAGCGLFGGGKEIDPTKDWSVSKLYSEARSLLMERNYTDAIKMYEKLNFEIKSRLRSYYRDGEDAYLMALELG